MYNTLPIYIYIYTYTYIYIYIYISYRHIHKAYKAAQGCPPTPFPRVTSVVLAPEDVEHPVGRRREAHMDARGGAGAGDEGAGGLYAEEQQEGDEQPAAEYVGICMCQGAIQTEGERIYVYIQLYICTGLVLEAQQQEGEEQPADTTVI
jgi:hypothetical protein